MAERLFGLETEYGFTTFARDGKPVDRGTALSELLGLAAQRWPHLPGMLGSGIFLTNGARYYSDCGHPEFAGPEVTNPWDAVRYLQAGDRLISELIAELVAQGNGIADAVLFKSNVDYGASTWASHESYLCTASPAALQGNLISHLVARTIFTGAGGFRPFPPGLEFSVSPRATHLTQSVSSGSTSNRGIYHTKEEALCGHGYRRLHLLCGETLNSELGNWLRVATTALVVAMIDAGLEPGQAVRLGSSLPAMHQIAADPHCRVSVLLKNGRAATAIGIERHYLQQAESHLGESWMPPWAEEACRQWRAMLDRLEQGGVSAVGTTLDWAIKLGVFRDHLHQRGCTWEHVAVWNSALAELALAAAGIKQGDRPLSVDAILDRNGPFAFCVGKLTPLLERHGLGWGGLEEFLALREELFEIDLRFGQLGGKGIFTALDQAGLLSHHFPGVDNIPHAMANPPGIGRARLRGECVRRFSGHNGRYACDWATVWDRQEQRFLDLSHPFASEEQWQNG